MTVQFSRRRSLVTQLAWRHSVNTYLHLPERGEVERRKQLSMDPELEVERLKTRVHTLEKELKCKGNNTYKVLKCWKFGKRRIYGV